MCLFGWGLIASRGGGGCDNVAVVGETLPLFVAKIATGRAKDDRTVWDNVARTSAGLNGDVDLPFPAILLVGV